METLLTVEQAATRLQLSPKTVRAQLRKGELRGIRRGRQWRITPEALEESSPPLPKNTRPGEERGAKAQAEHLWARLGAIETHNAAISEIAKAPAKVREFIAARSEAVMEAFYATPEGEAELADWRALDGEPFLDGDDNVEEGDAEGEPLS